MPNQTIDLMRGCEAWYDLDPRYYDNQRGVLADKSGHGRTAGARGGPTIGVEGPASFVATSFDGSDDEFRTPDTSTQEQTNFVVFKKNSAFDDGETVYGFGNNNPARGAIGFCNFGDFRFRFPDDSDNQGRLSYTTPSVGEFIVALHRWDGEVSQLFIDGEVVSQNPQTTHAEFNNTKRIGHGYGGDGSGGNFDGVIPVVARWSRALTEAEIQYLNNLTAPPRSL